MSIFMALIYESSFGATVARWLVFLPQQDAFIYKLALRFVAGTWLSEFVTAQTCGLAFVALQARR